MKTMKKRKASDQSERNSSSQWIHVKSHDQQAHEFNTTVIVYQLPVLPIYLAIPGPDHHYIFPVNSYWLNYARN